MKIWIFCLILINLHYTAIAIETLERPLPYTRCERSYKKLGCFKADPKLLSTLLITDRDVQSAQNDGHVLDWKRWEDSVHSLACRCAEAARKNGLKVFGLQNYGECWSGPGAEKTYQLGERSNECLMILKKPLPPCDMEDPRECMGVAGVNFIYGLDEDECIKNPCKNGGSCENTLGSFRCVCGEGFNGNQCEQDENECLKSPCKNGGSCVNTVGSFQCRCRPQFQGNLCEQDFDECKGLDPCQNGAKCSNTVGGFQCRCPAGFEGKLCSLDEDECTKSPCQNSGSCVNSFGSFRCFCHKGFTGKLCDQAFGCHTMPCQNDGTCINGHSTNYKCLCTPGYTGTDCEQDVNECSSQTCLNGARCMNTHGSFYCKCKNGYHGTFCEQGGCSSPGIYDLGFIIDGSGSVGNYGFIATKLFLLELIDQLDVGFQKTYIGAIVYSGQPQLICRFSDSRYYNPMILKLRILGWEFPDGDTRTDKALMWAGTHLYSKQGGDRIGVPNVLVVITDANTAQNSEPYEDVLMPLKERSVNIIAVGIHGVSRDELIKIAMGRNERVIQVDRIEDLDPVHLREMIYSIRC